MPEGTRKVGRPKMRWEDCVRQDIRTLGIKNWRSVALNRQEWRELLRKAKAHTGLSCHMMMMMMMMMIGKVEKIERNRWLWLLVRTTDVECAPIWSSAFKAVQSSDVRGYVSTSMLGYMCRLKFNIRQKMRACFVCCLLYAPSEFNGGLKLFSTKDVFYTLIWPPAVLPTKIFNHAILLIKIYLLPTII